MTSVQMHLALTHVPVILSFIGLITLVVAFFAKNNTITKTSYILLVVAGIAALPVFFSGEGAEEAIENLPTVSETIIERHEEAAKLAMISIAVAGLFALAALFSIRWRAISHAFKIMVLVLAVACSGLMAQTAHLGGQIRHAEIRNGAVQTGMEGSGINQGEVNQQIENDDD